jgi:V/A-type H+/Na+-transporting ATPase subunit I
MFKPVALEKYRVIVLQEEILSVLAKINELNVIELTQFTPDKAESEIVDGYSTTNRGKFASLQLTKLKRMQTFLSQFQPPQSKWQKIAGFLHGKKKETQSIPPHFDGLKTIATEEIGALNTSISDIERVLKEKEDRIAHAHEMLGIVKTLAQFNMPLDLMHGYSSIKVIAGKLPVELEEQTMKDIETVDTATMICTGGETEKIVLLSVQNEYESALNKVLSKTGFDRIAIPELQGTAENTLQELKKKIETAEHEKAQTQVSARTAYALHSDRIAALIETFEAEKYTANAFSLLKKTAKTTVLEFFVPKNSALHIKKQLQEMTEGKVIIEQQQFAEEDAPALLKNPRFVRNYEFVLEMFGFPHYGRFDPTIILALFFPIFFGLAFSDIAYGIMLTVLALFLRQTVGKQSVSNRRLTTILLHGGIFTILFGFVFGGAFGDMFNKGGIGAEGFKVVFGDYLYPLWHNPLSQEGAIGFLIAAILIGVLQVNLAVLIGLVEAVKQKQIGKAVFSSIVWFVLEAGVILLALNQIGNFSDEFLYAGGLLFLLAIVLLIKADGPLGLLGITGFGGNILSYTRLLALGLATGAIALALNIMGGLIMQLPYVGFILGPLFLIFGHVANFAFNLLGSFIHAMRLHFVEFFGYFFEGGGKKFSPFHFERALTHTGGK